ncbi:hypothetical protein JOM56_000988 [Amanita muscaria]|uniref:Uncharacterized protein n=1 Tax=Amanita muscaria (strain Koide BX008) TaxID=946122 RepID=A0A0C2X8U4_AMAMK|nr:hypothetical protein M378DRAFT_192279 [Amanita muscaria Koide BX008]
MSNNSNAYYFRRRTIGRAASPPTWACYEQIPYDDDEYSDSCSESCSEDDEEYHRSNPALHDDQSLSSDDNEDSPDDSDGHRNHAVAADDNTPATHTRPRDMDMDQDSPHCASPDAGEAVKHKSAGEAQKDVKGKQKATDPPEPEDRRRNRKKNHRPVYTLRPILTIHKSQGFVWNQDLFVPPYIKDRYVASTSPPNSRGFVSSSGLSTNSGLPDYEVEVVEIRIKEGELDRIIP